MRHTRSANNSIVFLFMILFLLSVKLSIKTGEGGKTFGAVSSKEIAIAMKEQNGIDIDKKKLKLDESIKALGTYEVPVKLHKDVTAKLKVVVEAG